MNKSNDILEYKGYHSRVEFDSVNKLLHGKIEGINDLVTFESCDLSEIENEFHKAVDDYLAFCEKNGLDPDKEYKGTFNIELSFFRNESLNSTVEKAIDFYIQTDAQSNGKG